MSDQVATTMTEEAMTAGGTTPGDDDSYRIEIDVPDDQVVDALAALDALGLRVEEEPAGEAAEKFASVEDLVAAERADEAGGEQECPFFPGFFVTVTGSLRVVKEYEVLVKDFRRRHNLKDDATLSVAASMDLDAAAMFRGKGVTGWRGLRRAGGEEIPFTEKTFTQMYRGRRFRAWVGGRYSRLSGSARQYRDDARGNS